MTKEEIKEYINSKIVGQGNQVDVSGILPTILKEIIDASVSPKVLELGEVDFGSKSTVTLSDEKRDEIWNVLFGHDAPDELQDIERDIMSLNTPIFVSPFRAINFGGNSELTTFYGWELSVFMSVDGDFCSIYITNPQASSHMILVLER